eukprot:SAG31_NODE_2479_length_5631_cov_99.073325_6_plen_47_part_00
MIKRDFRVASTLYLNLNLARYRADREPALFWIHGRVRAAGTRFVGY